MKKKTATKAVPAAAKAAHITNGKALAQALIQRKNTKYVKLTEVARDFLRDLMAHNDKCTDNHAKVGADLARADLGKILGRPISRHEFDKIVPREFDRTWSGR